MKNSEYLDVVKYIMIIIGKWFFGFKNQNLNFLYKIYGFFSQYFVVLMTQYIFINMFIYKHCHNGRSTELFCYYVQYTNVYLSGFLYKRVRMRNVFNYIMDYETTMLKLDHPTSVPIYLKYARWNRKIVISFIVGTVLTATIWYILVVKGITTESNDFCSLKKGLNYQLWYPVHLYNDFFVLIFLLDVSFYTTVVIYHIYNKITVIIVLIFALAQIKIVQNMICYMDEDAVKISRVKKIRYNEAILNVFRGCVEKHQEVIRLMNSIDTACKEIVLIWFFSNSFELAAFLIKLVTDSSLFSSIRTFIVLLLTITQIFMFFWYANEIQVQSRDISSVIYNETNWRNYDIKMQKNLLLMMVRSERPLACRAAAVGDMSIDTFKQIIKLCYSITAFFKTVYTDSNK